MSTDDDGITVTHAPELRRYELRDGGRVIGFTQYAAGERWVDFLHTEVDDGYAGRGLASRLVGHALADVRDSGRRIIPHCSYVAAWIRRHPEFADITDPPS